MKDQSAEHKVRGDFVVALETLTLFKTVPLALRPRVAHLIYNDSALDKGRAHKGVQGATSYWHQEMDAGFGRRIFQRINAAAKVFDVSPWSKQRRQTKAYRMTPVYRGIRDEFQRQVIREKKVGTLIDMSGRRIRTPPKAIASKRRDGMTAKLWRGVELRSLVPVHMQALTAFYEHCDAQLHGRLGPFEGHYLQQIDRQRDAAARLLVLAYTDLGMSGYIPVRYREAQSGRLYATDLNLQNCPRPVRFAALAGGWDYDINNCHFSILAQLSERAGFACPAIQSYLQNKDQVRARLAEVADADTDAIKKCLIALIYDAPLSKSPRAEFGRQLGIEKAGRLLALPDVIELAKEVKHAGKHVVDSWPVANQSIVNHARCGIWVNLRHRQKLAHILHGAEAVILKHAISAIRQCRLLLRTLLRRHA